MSLVLTDTSAEQALLSNTLNSLTFNVLRVSKPAIGNIQQKGRVGMTETGAMSVELTTGRRPRKAMMVQALCTNEQKQIFEIRVKDLSDAGIGGA